MILSFDQLGILSDNLRANFPELTDDRDIMGIAEEVGEFMEAQMLVTLTLKMVGGYLKYTGQSRNVITAEDYENEWADVMVCGALIGFRQFGASRAQEIINRKLSIMVTRGYKNRD